MAALVIDVGALADEKRQLQNGADAGALAVAQSCALGACVSTLASGLANDNSHDGASAASVSYPPGSQVRVDTSTRSGATSILPYNFAQVLTGVTGRTVKAAATATWGSVGRATAIRLAISACDVLRLGLNPVEQVIMFHTSTSTCDGSSGHDASGAFGWLDSDGTGNACELTVSVNQTAGADTGASGPGACLSPYLNKDILLPVFDDVVGVVGTGNNAKYLIKGFARFHITGYRFPGTSSVPPPPCSGSTDCLLGYFVRFVTPSAVLGGVNFGVSTVFLVS
jgi:hypothetical protein